MSTMLEVIDEIEKQRELDRADAARWRMVEQALIDWRDAEQFPANKGDGDGTCSFAQRQTRRRLRETVDAARRTLKLEAEAKR